MNYKIHFLDNESFDRLPAKHIESRIGVAYPESGEAYVRNTGSPLDVFTALHELEHLKGNDLDEHYDEENKCFYKSFGQSFDSIGKTVVPILGGLLGGPAGATAGAAMQDFAGGIVNKKGRAQANQSNQNQMMGQFQMPQQPGMDPSQGSNTPNIVPAGGVGGASAAGDAMGVGGKALQAIRSQDQSQAQYGFYSGRPVGF